MGGASCAGVDSLQMSNPELVHCLRQRVDSCTPTAVVRFGDGELLLLEAAADNAKSMQAAKTHVKGQTGLMPSSDTVLEIKAALEHAHNEADVLGVLAHDLRTGRRWIPADRLDAMCCARITAGRPPAALAGSLLNHAILAELPGLLGNRPLSVISCRDVRPVIEDQWKLDDVAVFQVPSQYRTRRVDGTYEATMYDISIWPNVHDRIRSELSVRERGEVFLVGAGLFGKDLCIQIRDQGGIALDMGSALDHIAGKVTRGAMRLVFDLYEDGLPIPDIATKLENRLDAPVDRDQLRDFIDTVSRYMQ